jgi:hypothetical protein
MGDLFMSVQKATLSLLLCLRRRWYKEKEEISFLFAKSASAFNYMSNSRKAQKKTCFLSLKLPIISDLCFLLSSFEEWRNKHCNRIRLRMPSLCERESIHRR